MVGGKVGEASERLWRQVGVRDAEGRVGEGGSVIGDVVGGDSTQYVHVGDRRTEVTTLVLQEVGLGRE